MGCRILDGGDDGAVLYCSTSMVAFGPVFASLEHAEDFVRWLGADADPRRLSAAALEASYSNWLLERTDDGALIDVDDAVEP